MTVTPIYPRPVHANTTFGVSCVGNIKALLISLSSVLNGVVLPGKISLRLNGEFPGFCEFYLEQLASLARLYGVDFSISVGASKGVRAARQWHLDNCTTEYLWMGDDDVVYDPFCLNEFIGVYTVDLLKLRGDGDEDWGYIVGSKPDVNNRRGYGDFTTAHFPIKDVKNYDSFNQFFSGSESRVVRVNTCDTGNVLINVRPVKDRGVSFVPFEESYNSGGEDTLFGLLCRKANLFGYFTPSARSVHLEKPASNFSEFAARGEMLLRAASALGLDQEVIKKEFMPFLTAHKTAT